MKDIRMDSKNITSRLLRDKLFGVFNPDLANICYKYAIPSELAPTKQIKQDNYFNFKQSLSILSTSYSLEKSVVLLSSHGTARFQFKGLIATIPDKDLNLGRHCVCPGPFACSRFGALGLQKHNPVYRRVLMLNEPRVSETLQKCKNEPVGLAYL